MTKNPDRSRRLAPAALLLLLAACGGGGDVAPVAPVAPPSGTVTLTAPSNGKLPWNRSTALGLVLKDAQGNAVANPSCTAADTMQLVVTSDCSSATGKRLGTQQVNVTGGGIAASVSIKVIVQRQPIGSHGVGSSNGSGGYNTVVTPDGKVLAWGANVSAGSLGQGQSSQALVSSPLPVAVKDEAGTGELSAIAAASAGNQFGLALTEDGEVYSWGYNAQGQLARDGVVNGSALPGKVRNPANSGNLTHIVEVSAGDANAVALADDGTVFTWGNYPGQGAAVGIGPSRYPAQVKDLNTNVLSGIVAVSAGWNFGLALGTDGKVYGWGWNAKGETGNPPSGTSPGGPPEALAKTVKRASDGSDLTDIVGISAGYNFSLALGADGHAYGWGSNDYGQIGQNTLNDPRYSAVVVKGIGGAGTLDGLVMVSAGGNHALALNAAGDVYSWGYAQSYALGDGANRPITNQTATPIRVVGENSIGALSGVVAISTGYQHSLALKSDGSLLIWGDGFRGNLGQGSAPAVSSAVPTPVKNTAGSAALLLAPLTAYPNLVRRGR